MAQSTASRSRKRTTEKAAKAVRAGKAAGQATKKAYHWLGTKILCSQCGRQMPARHLKAHQTLMHFEDKRPQNQLRHPLQIVPPAVPVTVPPPPPPPPPQVARSRGRRPRRSRGPDAPPGPSGRPPFAEERRT
jgi:hypothetical protein